MARKKKDKPSNPFQPLNEQVMRGDTLTIADVRQFITDAKKKREDWLNIADRSWAEIKKRNRKGKLYGGNDLDRARRWSRFPLWWSCWKIRQPITFARLPIPILKDTQGDDPYGRTACILGERLTRGILKTFDAFEEFSASNDDFLITDFGWGRVFYRKEDCIEEEKVRLQVIEQQPREVLSTPSEEGVPAQEAQPELPPLFIGPDGQPIDNPLFDEFGPYIKTGQEIVVDNEEVYFEAGLYSNLYVDDVRRWNKVTRLAFEYQYSYREFKEKFGQSALDKLARGDIEEHRMGKPIICFEYHDKFLKEVRWFAENSEDFFQPTAMQSTLSQDATEIKEYDNSDLYGLSGFFPCTEPLLINCSTDEFWPTPEFFQVMDILEDIHSIVSRMMLLTKAIRVRFLFDSSIPQMQQLIGETGEGGGLGIPNLEQALMNNNGKLSNLVAYFPVDEMIQGLNNMYAAFEQRLNMFYQITGLSDLIRGQTTDGDKTFGERQLEGKFALNRIEPRQRKIQEWVKNNYQLLMEMALKMFSDKTLDEYITPQTLDEEDKQRYEAALELLKSNKRRRFRVDFETDATIAINQEWKKAKAIELANALTKAMESTAKVAETQPELASTELKVLKHLIGEFSDGKLFVDEIQDAIQEVIDRVAAPQEPEVNIELEKLKLDGQRLNLDAQKFQVDQQWKQLELQSKEQIEIAKIERDERIAGIEAQLDQFKISVDSQATQLKLATDAETARAELEKEYQKIGADISLAQEELALKRDELLVEMRKVVDKKEMDEFSNMVDARVVAFEEQLSRAQHDLESTKMLLDQKEKYATEARLQAEHQLALGNTKLESLEKLIDLALKKKELDMPVTAAGSEEPEEPKKPRKKRAKVIRDEQGLATELQIEEVE